MKMMFLVPALSFAFALSGFAQILPPTKEAAKGKVSLQFNQTPLETVLDLYGELTGKSVLVNPKIAAQQINFKSRNPLAAKEAIIAIETLLVMHGLMPIPFRDDFVRIEPVEKGIGLVPLKGIP